jgi:hypothetical protein
MKGMIELQPAAAINESKELNTMVVRRELKTE